MKKKILVDLTYVDPKNPTGVSTFALRLMFGLDGIELTKNTFKFILIVNSKNEEYIKRELKNDDYVLYNCKKEFGLSINSYKKWLENIISKLNVDAYFVPFFTIWTVLPKNTRTIAVIHDIQPLQLNNKAKNILYQYIVKAKIKRLYHIVTISEYSKNMIEIYFPIAKGKISVIYNSLGKTNYLNCASIVNEDYILNVNALCDYKNQITLIKAFDRIKEQIPHILIFKGRKNEYWENVLKPYIEKHNLCHRVMLLDKNMTNEEMASLYGHADLFVNPSQMEGFGFTPLEAALHETPVLTTKCTALYETTLGKLEYYDPPTDDVLLAERILICLNNRKTDEQLHSLSCLFEEKYSQEVQANSYYLKFRMLIKT